MTRRPPQEDQRAAEESNSGTPLKFHEQLAWYLEPLASPATGQVTLLAATSPVLLANGQRQLHRRTHNLSRLLLLWSRILKSCLTCSICSDHNLCRPFALVPPVFPSSAYREPHSTSLTVSTLYPSPPSSLPLTFNSCSRSTPAIDLTLHHQLLPVLHPSLQSSIRPPSIVLTAGLPLLLDPLLHTRPAVCSSIHPQPGRLRLVCYPAALPPLSPKVMEAR
jgi:hypothetical protein